MEGHCRALIFDKRDLVAGMYLLEPVIDRKQGSVTRVRQMAQAAMLW